MKISKITIISLLFVFSSLIVQSHTTFAISSPILSNQTTKNSHTLFAGNGAKAQNNIIFYNENELPSNIDCSPGGGTGDGINSAVGGSNEQQVYWCALRQIYDETHSAAIFGNIIGEGAFNPVRWQYGTTYHPNDGGPFTVPWDTVYNSNALGVGVIQITSLLSDYLHYINKEAPDLLKYFQDPEKYSYAEGAMSKIGDTDFRRLVVLEINYINDKYVGNRMTTFTNITDLTEASYWWTKVVEDCPCCGGSYASQYNGGCSSQLAPRASAAAQQLQSMSGISCSGGSPSSSSPNVSGEITWIGDSYSVGAKSRNLLPNGADTGGDSYIQVSKFVSTNNADGAGGTSCLDILKNVIDSGKLKPQLVLACGTNGGWTSSDISRFENLIKDQNVNAVVVTSRTKNSDYKDSNDLLKKLANSNSKVNLADWAAVYKPEYYASDSIHPNDGDGYKAWTRTIKSALSGSGNSSGSSGSASSSGSSHSSGSSSSSNSKNKSSNSSGGLDAIKNAKNASKSVFNTDQYGQWGANWDDNDTASLKRALETYGDLAYQTGKAIGAPWKAIFAQMRYEDPGSVCGKNNFWGMGCPPGTTSGNGSNYDTLGDGFIGYANYATKICNGAQNVSDKPACEASLKVSDPLQYLKNLGPLWVQGDANGQGYWFIDAISSSLNKLDAFLATDEGKAIVEKFGNYTGDDTGGGCSLETVEIPSYNQCSGDWASYPYNYAPGKTICNGGCGPSSMAMLVTALTGQTVYPNEIVDLTTSAGQYPNSDVGYELTQIVADKYNLEAQKISYSSKQDAYDKMKKYLNDGYVIHLSGEGSHPGFSNSNTSGHYIGLVSIDSNDKVRVANSNSVGNNTTDLQNIVDAIHNGAFVILKNKDGSACNGSSGNGSGDGIDPCDNSSSSSSGISGDTSSGDYGSDSSATTECGKKALASAKKIIDIANQYGFDYNQGSHDLSGQFDEILKGRYFETDCTGFASFVMYDAFGVKEVFWTGSIASNSNYKEVPKSEVQVGDIFNYNYGCTAHGGIITKIENGKITEIAQTGRPEYLTSGTSSKNGRLGYSYYPNLDNGNLNCVNSASDVKYYRYKGCN